MLASICRSARNEIMLMIMVVPGTTGRYYSLRVWQLQEKNAVSCLLPANFWVRFVALVCLPKNDFLSWCQF